MRLLRIMPVASIFLAAACVKRPPPIVAPHVLPDSAAPCTMETGMDTDGDPNCSSGCEWDRARKQCAPLPGAPPPESSGALPSLPPPGND